MKKVVSGVLIVLFLASMLSMAFNVAPVNAIPDPVTWFAEDTTTKGNWYPTAAGSPIGVYGSYAYILPNPPLIRVEVPVGDYSFPVGGYSELPSPPYSWTGSQIGGLQYWDTHPPYPSDAPYCDEYWSKIPEVTYEAIGTRIDLGIPFPPRELIDVIDGTSYIRAACGWRGTTITLTLSLPAGSQLLSLYILDYDTTARRETITVSDGVGVSATKIVNYQFDGGLYENFFVYLTSAGTVTVTITWTAGANAVVSGVFLSATSLTPTVPGVNEIRFENEDATTKGNWMGTYGDLGYIKCAWNVPGTKTNYSWTFAYDATGGLFATEGSYSADESQYAWTAKLPLIEYVQYPVFEWAWEGWQSSQGADPRRVYYPVGSGGNHWRLACWDDGGERCLPLHGYMNFPLFFPEGTYLLSLYAYDYERNQRTTQEYRIYDETMTPLTDPVQISGTAFDEGIYEIFMVVAPPGGLTIIVQVYNDAGHPSPTLNVLLSGIFVDKLEYVCGLTIGFWKTNAAKDLGLIKGTPQVLKDPYLGLLGCVVDGYSGDISDWGEWGISKPIDNVDLKWALHWLSYGAYDPTTNGFTLPEASNSTVKARAQLLALLLTACYKGSSYTNGLITIPGYDGPHPISYWIDLIIGYYNSGDYETVYYLANYLNEHCALSPVDP